MLPFFSFLLFYDCSLFWYQRFNPHAYWSCHFLVFFCVFIKASGGKRRYRQMAQPWYRFLQRTSNGMKSSSISVLWNGQRGVTVLFWTTFLHWQNGLSTFAVILEARSCQVWLLPNEVTHVATRCCSRSAVLLELPQYQNIWGANLVSDVDAGEKRGKSSCLNEKFNIGTYCFVAFVQLVFQVRKA